MRVALAVNHVDSDRNDNINRIEALIHQAADAGADVVVFPETATSGLINNDDPEHDWPLGLPVPGEITDQFAKLAEDRSIWIAIGLIEIEGTKLYDTAIFINPQGEIGLKYRRVHPNWHTPQADPDVYGQGEDIPVLDTPFGSFMFLICGDLWDDDIVERASQNRADYLLFPFARSFEDRSWDQEKWNREEMDDYADRIKLVGSTAFMTNYLSSDIGGYSDGCFGGAWIIKPDGTVTERFPLGQSGLLIADISNNG
ncbi:carbon-nitrogen hydrolase family protein [Paenibacillus spongiae]|uniref:Carbon-nitrogen hydrolase family protein n=1 Tax=Paenibacillus spongiae TaxID=2909671 RepID=A0ABY5SL29_9BACL|nr:carbon-nitrogen hydrolase family protein [Paenibacillus spongiae]UVI33273.1 carbon-nitrogen hydrolase family protein [Paenibacillus spongiae]